MHIYLKFVVLITISCALEAKPTSSNSVKSIPEKNDKTKETPIYVGCFQPFQYVNPYYHELTARTCVNILGLNAYQMVNPINVRTGCDCMYPFAMNYTGYCIREDLCNENEAFGYGYMNPFDLTVEPTTNDEVMTASSQKIHSLFGESVNGAESSYDYSYNWFDNKSKNELTSDNINEKHSNDGKKIGKSCEKAKDQFNSINSQTQLNDTETSPLLTATKQSSVSNSMSPQITIKQIPSNASNIEST